MCSIAIVCLLAVGLFDGVWSTEVNATDEIIPIKTVVYAPHVPIRINSDAEFSSRFVNRTIWGLDISLNLDGACIYIGNCSQPFTVKNCHLHCNSSAPIYFFNYGIYLYHTSNGEILNNNISLNYNSIYLLYSNKTTLKNNTLHFVDEGIIIESSNNNTLINNTFRGGYFAGVDMKYSQTNTLKENTFGHCSVVLEANSLIDCNSHIIDTTNLINNKPIYYYKNQSGISVPKDAGQIIISNCSKIRVDNQTFINESICIQEFYSYNCSFLNNNFSTGDQTIQLYYSDNNTIKYNICSNWDDGLQLDNSNDNLIQDNIYSGKGHYGISLSRSNRNKLIHNNCSYLNDFGIFLFFSKYNLITNNNCSWLNKDGIYSWGSTFNLITNNSCYGNANGIVDSAGCRNNTLIDNLCLGNCFDGMSVNINDTAFRNNCSLNKGNGIWIDSYTALIDNYLYKNNWSGLYIMGTGNTITNNNFIENTQYGINAWNGPFNRIYNNNFIDNNGAGQSYNKTHIQAHDESGRNFWNDTNGDGNYWSDWAIPDNDKNGYVDNPYIINDTINAKDYFPLTLPNGQAKRISPNYPLVLVASIALFTIVIIGGIIFFVPSFYTRIRREQVMDHFIRGQVYDHIRKKPGSSSTAIKIDLNLNRGTLLYHLRTLEMQGFVKSQREGKSRKYYEIDVHPLPGDGRRYSKLQSDILDLLQKKPGFCQSELSRELNIPLSVVNYNVKILIKQGAIRVEKGKWGKMHCFVDEK